MTVFGNCGKHPGYNMVNCPMCEIEQHEKDRILVRNILCPQYVVTTWGAVLKLVRVKKGNKLITVSDPSAIDAGMDIGVNDIVLIAREKL